MLDAFINRIQPGRVVKLLGAFVLCQVKCYVFFVACHQRVIKELPVEELPGNTISLQGSKVR